MKKKTNDEGPEVGPLLARQKWERLAARIMELGPYELAALAARICPELCLKNPVEAIRKARRLLQAVGFEAEKSDSELMAGIAQLPTKRRVSYKEGLKEIIPWVTGKPGRAEGYLLKYLAHIHGIKKSKALLNVKQNKGFTETEVTELKNGVAEWWPQHNRKKGKQGQVKSDSDERLGARAVLPRALVQELERIATEHGVNKIDVIKALSDAHDLKLGP